VWWVSSCPGHNRRETRLPQYLPRCHIMCEGSAQPIAKLRWAIAHPTGVHGESAWCVISFLAYGVGVDGFLMSQTVRQRLFAGVLSFDR